MKWWIVMVLVALALAWMAFVPMRRESAPVLGIAVANAEPTAEPAADMEGSSPDTDLAVARLSASELQGPEVDAPVESDGAGLPVAGAESQPPPAEPPPPRDFFPHGRPPPDWVFEQKYAGLSESAFALRKEEVAAAYGLASKRAFQEC